MDKIRFKKIQVPKSEFCKHLNSECYLKHFLILRRALLLQDDTDNFLT